ncbi:MAG: hypothetical protein Q4A65_07565 [Bacillota bacterium]|nr:hypothetical protein [Bacillota bacterium]
MDLRDYISKSIKLDEKRLSHCRKLYRESTEGLLKCKTNRKTGKREYYIKLPDDSKYQYAGQKKRSLVVSIQNRRFAGALIRILEHNIRCKQTVLHELWSDDNEDVLRQLPDAYVPSNDAKAHSRRKIKQSENPFKPEELKLETSFGLWVRSRGELAIAELLYSLGITFYYERKLTLLVTRYDDVGVPYKTRQNYYPDFTIILGNGLLIYWEHKGLMKKRSYVERDIQKENDYNMNGIYQSHNLIVTADGPDNEIDMEGIKRIITGWLMPLEAL